MHQLQRCFARVPKSAFGTQRRLLSAIPPCKQLPAMPVPLHKHNIHVADATVDPDALSGENPCKLFNLEGGEWKASAGTNSFGRYYAETNPILIDFG